MKYISTWEHSETERTGVVYHLGGTSRYFVTVSCAMPAGGLASYEEAFLTLQEAEDFARRLVAPSFHELLNA